MRNREKLRSALLAGMLASVSFGGAIAQQPLPAKLNASGTSFHWRFEAGESPDASQLRSAGVRMGLGDQDRLELLRSTGDALGMQHQRLQQYHAGYPVLGGMVVAHLAGGRLAAVNGHTVQDLPAPDVRIGAQEALLAAVTATGAQALIWQGEHADLRWVPQPALWYVPNQRADLAGDYRLAWKVDVYATQPLFRADCYIDAVTGQLIFRNETLHSADAQGIGHTHYSGQQNIVTDSVGTYFRLRETGRAQGVETYDMLNGTDYNSAMDIVQADNVWDTFPTPEKRAGLDAHWGAEMTYDYFSLFHGRDSYDDAGSKLISYVHYDNNYSNAFWNGVFMTYGDGGSNSNPFCGLDVCGHEFAHGVTEYSAGLVYAYEPGALNESFSDIFGNAIEFWSRPGNASWNIGDDIGAFRSMSDPKAHQNPDTYLGSFWATGGFDNGGVHYNSGVQNYWFYLLSAGGSGVNDNGDSYNISGLGIDTAAQIAYRNLNVYLTPTSGYAEARYFAIQSAIDLYGECSNAMIQTMNAWHAVGVGNPYTGVLSADFYTADTNICVLPATVQFQNQSFSGISYFWDFGDGGSSTAESPSHTYQNAGDYTVTLIAVGCFGERDTMVVADRIHIDPLQPCTVNMPSSGDSLLQTGCEGFLYDSGGADDYLPNTNSKVVLDPAGNQQVRLEFSAFNYAAGDRVTIFDGPGTSYPLIGLYAGTNLPPVAVSTNGALTVVESTNGANNRSGFAAAWTCFLVGTDPAEAAGSFSVAPNPSNGQVQLRWARTADEAHHIAIHDATGRLVWQRGGRHQGQWTESLDLGALPAGMYIVRATAGEATAAQRIIVQ